MASLSSRDNESPSSLFVKDGVLTVPSFCILLGLPLVFFSSRTGGWWVGLCIVVMGLVIALCTAMNEMAEEDKLDIQFNVYSAQDILMILERLENNYNNNTSNDDDNHHNDASSSPNTITPMEQARLHQHLLAALSALVKKYNKYQRRRQRQRNKKDNDNDYYPQEYTPPSESYRPHELECICQDAVYCAMRLCKPYDNNDNNNDNNNNNVVDEVVAGALALHALVAKDDVVRRRHLYQADLYGLDVPIRATRAALERAKSIRHEGREQAAAELQRKACLLLGALADGHPDTAQQLGSEGALDAILQGLGWYRFHDEYCNWALWAIFVLCYDHAPNKTRLFQLGGIETVCQTLLANPESLEVARHGTAVLFDMLREVDNNNDAALDLGQVRHRALQAGLHRALSGAMDKFHESMEITAMGTEMLAATGYEGATTDPTDGNDNTSTPTVEEVQE